MAGKKSENSSVKKTTKTTVTLEQAFTELELIVKQMEDTQMPLEEAFDSYQKGMELLKICNEQIDTVEKKVLVIDESGNLNEF
ncbi:MAG: exodeoxyribonuclease VII small subunit [Lachnospiraceae bacterium]|nr:exodeoxyribonuclease VII small subunit [Lachnospiraceae bacterium]MDD3659110.1 exodeoxyribonuclease VII small subunit [Lachnospiraceae bacterium]